MPRVTGAPDKAVAKLTGMWHCLFSGMDTRFIQGGVAMAIDGGEGCTILRLY